MANDPDEILMDCAMRCRSVLNHLILNRISPRLKTQFASWTDLPGLLSLARKSQQPADKDARRAKKLQPLDIVARKMNEWFPELKIDRRLPMTIGYRVPITDEISFVINWMTEQHFNKGQAVKLSLGLRPAAQLQSFDSPQLVRPISHYFGEADTTFWAAESIADIDTIGSPVRDFLSLMIGEMETLKDGDGEFPGMARSMHTGAVTARQAHDIAKIAGREWDDQARLIGIVTSLFETERLGWPLTSDGQLRPHGAWHLRYWSALQQRQAEAWVPYAGQVEFRRFVDPTVDNSPPIQDTWIDSPQAVAFASSQNIPPLFKLSSMTLRGSQPGAAQSDWQVCFAPERDFQHGTAVTLNAFSGECIQSAQG